MKLKVICKTVFFECTLCISIITYLVFDNGVRPETSVQAPRWSVRPT